MSPPPTTAKDADGDKDSTGSATPRASVAPAPAAVNVPRRVRPPLTPRAIAGKASERARQVAAIILEVLAGQRTPAQAAQELAVVPVRYYQIETRALAGLLNGCEPALRGRQAVSEDERKLTAECARLRQEAARTTAELGRVQALIRAARSAFGLRPPAPAAVKPGKGGRPGRQRKPRVRALRLARLLKPEAAAPPPPAAIIAGAPAGG